MPNNLTVEEMCKLAACEKRGIKITIWFDDDPVKLVRGH